MTASPASTPMQAPPLTDDDRALLRALARDRLAGQRVGFWIGVHVFVLGMAALLFGLSDPDQRERLRPAFLPGLPVVLVLGNALYAWARYRSRALRTDLTDAVKHRLACCCDGLSARGGRLVYTVSGQPVAVRYLGMPARVRLHARLERATGICCGAGHSSMQP